MRLLIIFASCFLLPFAAQAQSVSTCADAPYGAARDIQLIAEPMANSIKTFANGEVDLVLIDTVEPAAAAFHVMVLHPPRDEMFGTRDCHLIGAFSGIMWEGLRSSYDPATGLHFFVEAQVYQAETALFVPMEAEITVNQATGEVGLDMRWLD